jgi:hypothetical protein
MSVFFCLSICVCVVRMLICVVFRIVPVLRFRYTARRKVAHSVTGILLHTFTSQASGKADCNI